MQPGAAIDLCRRAPFLLVAFVAGCASSGYEPGELSPELAEQCRDLETAYRAGDPMYPAKRDALAADPTAAAWLTRMFVRDLILIREGRPLGEDTEFLASAAKLGHRVETGALGEIKSLGVRAVPTLVGDLLLHDQPQPRELGIELLALVGTPAVPAVQKVAREGDDKNRRAAARTLGRIGVDDAVFKTLSELAVDGDYTVRADALRSLRTGGEPSVQLLLARLHDDEDPFVRRVAVQTLGEWKSTRTATVLIDYLEQCKRDRNWLGEQAAQTSLQRMAGTRGPRTPDAWRALAADFGPLQPSAPAVDVPPAR
jgi:hypothetical protein